MDEELFNKYKEMKKTAFILGFTGSTGRELVKELVNSQMFQTVRLLGRREVEFPDEEKYKCLEQKVIDFENLDEHKAAFDGCDVGFSCLGTTRGKSGKDGFYKVDHDYVVNTAKVAKDTGCKQLHLVSSSSASANSMFYYMKVKGQVEQELKEMGFDQLTVYRPAMLLGEREESRPMEKIATVLIAPIKAISPSALSTPTKVLAKAMANKCFLKSEQFEILENRAIFVAAGEIKEKTKKEAAEQPSGASN